MRHLVEVGKTNPIQTQYKPNLRKPKMNVNKVLTKDYENNPPGGLRKNKPNSKPISPPPRKQEGRPPMTVVNPPSFFYFSGP